MKTHVVETIFQKDGIDERYCDTELARIRTAQYTPEPAQPREVTKAAQIIAMLADTWSGMNASAHLEVLLTLFEVVVIDKDSCTISEWIPRRELAALFEEFRGRLLPFRIPSLP